MGARRHPLRLHIVTMFRHGDLVSVAEAVLISDVSRQSISRWLRAAGIDKAARRLAYVARQRVRAQRILEGRPPPLKPTKAQMRQVIADAMAETVRRRAP